MCSCTSTCVHTYICYIYIYNIYKYVYMRIWHLGPNSLDWACLRLARPIRTNRSREPARPHSLFSDPCLWSARPSFNELGSGNQEPRSKIARRVSGSIILMFASSPRLLSGNSQTLLDPRYIDPKAPSFWGTARRRAGICNILHIRKLHFGRRGVRTPGAL